MSSVRRWRNDDDDDDDDDDEGVDEAEVVAVKTKKRVGAASALTAALKVAAEDEELVEEIEDLIARRQDLDKAVRARTETMFTTMLNGIPSYHLNEAVEVVKEQFNEVEYPDFASKPSQQRRTAERQQALKLFKELDDAAQHLSRRGLQPLLLVNEDVDPYVVVSVVHQLPRLPGLFRNRQSQYETVLVPTILRPRERIVVPDIAFESTVYIITHLPCTAMSVGEMDEIYDTVRNLPEGEFFAIAPLQQYGQQLFPTAAPFRLHAGHECDTEDCDAEAGVKARKVTYIAGKRLHYAGISALFPQRMLSDKERRRWMASTAI
jgi:hypothetical protein